MGLVFLQANDGHSATRSFDVVASQGLPVAFYAEMRGHKQDQAVKCELSRDRVRLIYLSSYDKKGNPAPPSKPAGEDGLGDMVMDPSDAAPAGFRFSGLDLERHQESGDRQRAAQAETCQAGNHSVPDLLAFVYARSKVRRRAGLPITTRGCLCVIRAWRIPSWEPKA